VADEFETRLIHVDQGAERFVGTFILGPGVNQRALGPGKGQRVAVGFEQVLADFLLGAIEICTNLFFL
jgi:hypothetical protein